MVKEQRVRYGGKPTSTKASSGTQVPYSSDLDKKFKEYCRHYLKEIKCLGYA